MPTISTELDVPADAQLWPSSVFSLVVGAFLLPIGRIADIYGGHIVLTGGLAWFFVWTLVAGFSTNYAMFIACRALQGLGPAASLPAGLMLMGKIYRPGPRKNLIFSLYGAFSPVGFFLGILVGGVTGQYLSWRWYFWLGSIAVFAAGVGASLSVPNDRVRNPAGDQMDYWGIATTVPALVLIVFAVTSGAHAPQGFKTDYIIVTLVLGAVLLGVAIFLEKNVVAYPLLPAGLFKPRHMKRLMLSLIFAYGTFGIFVFYASF